MQLEQINNFANVFYEFAVFHSTLNILAMFFYKRVVIINDKFQLRRHPWLFVFRLYEFLLAYRFQASQEVTKKIGNFLDLSFLLSLFEVEYIAVLFVKV